VYKTVNCPLCGKAGAKEQHIPGQDKYEIKCDVCTVYHLTQVQDEAFISLPEQKRLALSAHVREQYEKTGLPVHLDWLENFRHIVGD
jgi:phage FluMu protein Com